jgi:salicylate hydroxylase
MSELKTWTKDFVALLGDTCHLTLPYQAQGAAMAVEDGAAIGILIGSLSQSRLQDREAHIPEILRLYEAMRKRRTTTNVQGAIENRHLF